MVGVGYLTELTWLSALLILGVLASIIANKINLPDIILLLIIGIIGGKYVSFPSNFLTGLGIFALIMILFDSTSKVSIREIKEYTSYALKMTFSFLILTVIFMSIFVILLFNLGFTGNSVLLSILFASVLIGTDAGTVLSFLEGKKDKISEILEFESIINTPLSVLIPIIILNFYLGSIQTTGSIVITFLQSIMTGVGSGLILGLVIFSFMKRYYLEELISPLVIIASALITYTLAENIGGSGVLAVTTLGLVFGRFYIKQKENAKSFISIFTNFLRIVLFVLLGSIIKIPFNVPFLLKSFALFGIYILVRYVAISIALYKSGIKRQDKVFMSLQASKGVAVAVVTFIIAGYAIPEIQNLITLLLLFILYSIILSSIALKFYKGASSKVSS